MCFLFALTATIFNYFRNDIRCVYIYIYIYTYIHIYTYIYIHTHIQLFQRQTDFQSNKEAINFKAKLKNADQFIFRLKTRRACRLFLVLSSTAWPSHQIYAPSKVALYYVVASNLIILTDENISKINDMNFINFTSRQATQLIVSDHSNWAHFVHKS